MKYIISFLIITVLFLSVPYKTYAYSAKAMVVIEQKSGCIVYSHNSDEKLPMASTTKIMTALVVLENLSLDTVVVVDEKAVGIEGSSMYLQKGETLTVEQLLYGLMLTSGNDAATALAIAVSGNECSFVALMNEKATSLGLKNTNFKNPSGLPHDEHYTTAYELAIITRTALENPVFARIVSTKSISIPYNGTQNGRTLKNHNRLLSMYDSAVGVKTGFTKKAGRCLVSAAQKNGITLICVTLNDGNDWQDHIDAFENSFDKLLFKQICYDKTLSVTLKAADGTTVFAHNTMPLEAVIKKDAIITNSIKAEPFIYYPRYVGDKVGEIVFYADGNEIARDDLILSEALVVSENKKQHKKQLFITKIILKIKKLFKRN